jgi:hypothetical protein
VYFCIAGIERQGFGRDDRFARECGDRKAHLAG